MARKAAPGKAHDQGALLVAEDYLEPPQLPPPPPSRPRQVSLAIEQVRPEAVAVYQETPVQGPVATCSLDVADGYWMVSGVIVADGGEVQEVLEAKGVTTADGVLHSGWILAALEAMRMVQTHGPMPLELRIPDPGPVGFLRMTLSDRVKMAAWDEDTRKRPWPPLYQEYLNLAEATGALVNWSLPQ